VVGVNGHSATERGNTNGYCINFKFFSFAFSARYGGTCATGLEADLDKIRVCSKSLRDQQVLFNNLILDITSGPSKLADEFYNSLDAIKVEYKNFQASI
jgi:hypothetical protein